MRVFVVGYSFPLNNKTQTAHAWRIHVGEGRCRGITRSWFCHHTHSLLSWLEIVTRAAARLYRQSANTATDGRRLHCSLTGTPPELLYHRLLEEVPPLVLHKLDVGQGVLVRSTGARCLSRGSLPVSLEAPEVFEVFEVSRVVPHVRLHHPDERAAVKLGPAQLLDAARPREVAVGEADHHAAALAHALLHAPRRQVGRLHIVPHVVALL